MRFSFLIAMAVTLGHAAIIGVLMLWLSPRSLGHQAQEVKLINASLMTKVPGGQGKALPKTTNHPSSEAAKQASNEALEPKAPNLEALDITTSDNTTSNSASSPVLTATNPKNIIQPRVLEPKAVPTQVVTKAKSAKSSAKILPIPSKVDKTSSTSPNKEIAKEKKSSQVKTTAKVKEKSEGKKISQAQIAPKTQVQTQTLAKTKINAKTKVINEAQTLPVKPNPAAVSVVQAPQNLESPKTTKTASLAKTASSAEITSSAEAAPASIDAAGSGPQGPLPEALEGDLILSSKGQLRYPPLCQRRGVSGRVLVELTLDAKGTPVKALALTAVPRCEDFTKEALRYALSRKYTLPQGRFPRGVRVKLGVNFKLR